MTSALLRRYIAAFLIGLACRYLQPAEPESAIATVLLIVALLLCVGMSEQPLRACVVCGVIKGPHSREAHERDPLEHHGMDERP